MVVKSPTEVELPQHTALDGERLRMDDGQLVVAEVQRSEALQARKCVRLHLIDPGERRKETSHTTIIKIKVGFATEEQFLVTQGTFQ